MTLRPRAVALFLGFAGVATAAAACEANLEIACYDGTCLDEGATVSSSSDATTTGVGGGGAGGMGQGGDGGNGTGGEAPACLSCLEATGAQTGDLPCEIETILKDKCQRCHGSPLKNGAPFGLIIYSDTQADYFGEIIYSRMHGAVSTGFMPLTPPKLTDEEKSTLVEWLCACAPPAGPGEACP